LYQESTRRRKVRTVGKDNRSEKSKVPKKKLAGAIRRKTVSESVSAGAQRKVFTRREGRKGRTKRGSQTDSQKKIIQVNAHDLKTRQASSK